MPRGFKELVRTNSKYLVGDTIEMSKEYYIFI